LTVSDHDEQPPQKVTPPYPPSRPFILAASHTISQNENQPLFSEQNSRMDYVTLNGIGDRTGFEKEDLHLLVLKELLDNAVDYLEKNYPGSNEIPDVKVFITVRKSDDNKDYLTFKVDNSNNRHPDVAAGRTSAITIEMLTSIFNFDSFFSSKRNQYKITRGALGDALKEVICVSQRIQKY
jgi:hypothetical protein